MLKKLLIFVPENLVFLKELSIPASLRGWIPFLFCSVITQGLKQLSFFLSNPQERVLVLVSAEFVLNT